jgi:hypothetical protein
VNKGADPESETILLHNFVAYLKAILNEKSFNERISVELSTAAVTGNGTVFDKPVWDFHYPESSLFITEEGLIGCCIQLRINREMPLLLL